jgi:Sulfotransferase domain
MRWNFSSRARELSQADAVVISIPKSGRTWLRVFVSAYFCAKTGREFSIGATEQRSHGIPRIVYSHDCFEHRTKATLWERVRGKYLVPPEQLKRAPIILLARDPRDAFVSYFLQLTRRHHPAAAPIKRLSAAALLRHPRFGIGNMVAVMNDWAHEFGRRADFSIVRYEELRANPADGFRNVLRALGEEQIREEAFAEALRFSSFENMKTLEASGAFRDKILTPRDREDPESFKVRRGQVGGFAEYFSAADERFAAAMCKKLNRAFGYAIGGRLD